MLLKGRKLGVCGPFVATFGILSLAEFGLLYLTIYNYIKQMKQLYSLQMEKVF